MKTFTAMLLTLLPLSVFAEHEDPCDRLDPLQPSIKPRSPARESLSLVRMVPDGMRIRGDYLGPVIPVAVRDPAKEFAERVAEKILDLAFACPPPEKYTVGYEYWEIIAILDSYQEAAISTRSSHLSKERGKALEFYNMEPYGNETKTGSKVVTSEVFDTVETIATRLVKVFTSTDKAVEFVPEGPEDIDGADQKTKYANYIFYRENNGFNVLYEAIKDGLIIHRTRVSVTRLREMGLVGLR
jgi:hypothetical protein